MLLSLPSANALPRASCAQLPGSAISRLVCQALRNGLQAIGGAEEGICGVLIAKVDLDLGDFAIDDAVMGAVQGIEPDAVNFFAVRMSPVDFHNGIVEELVDADEIHLDTCFIQFAKEGDHLVRAALGAGEGMAAWQVPHDVRREYFTLDRRHITTVETLVHFLHYF